MTDHSYRQFEVEQILAEFSNVAIGTSVELESINVSIAHLHTYNHNSQILDYLKGKRTVFTIHSLLRCEADSNNVDMSLAIDQQEKLIAGCDEIVLVSYAELEHYYKLDYQKLNTQVNVIHNGLKHPGRQHPNTVTRKLGFCGRLVPRKRPEYVQMILKEKGFEEYSTLIAGRGFSSYARDLIQDTDLNHRICYLGWCGRERLEAFYNSIELLAIPSVYEPFGMVALEAMARYIPVVCTRIASLVEVLGENAIFAENYRYESFKDAMLQWLNMDIKKRNSMVQAARDRYSRFFTDVSMAGKYFDLFQRLS